MKISRQTSFKVYWKLESLITPRLKYSQSIYEDVLNEHCARIDKWLDLGCGHHLLPPWRLDREKVLVGKSKLMVGMDYDHASLTKHKSIKRLLRGDISRLPFPDNTFDLITANMVFEHLEKPERQLKEISRVLSKNGKLVFHTPNTLGYSTLLARIIPQFIKDKLIYILEGRDEEDVFPAYYKINSPARIRDLAVGSGLNVVEIKLICSSAVFSAFPPIVVLELLWIRFLMSKVGKRFRPNLIAILEKT